MLTTSVFASFTAFCAAEGLGLDDVRDAFARQPQAGGLLADFERGRIAEAEFEPRFCAVLGLGADRATGLVDRLFAGMRAEPAMLAALGAARGAGIRTGLVSNSWGHGRYDRTRFPELFDGVVISGEVGLRKPDPRIYELGAEAIGLPPAACVFVDDIPSNLGPARELGMATVHHTAPADTLPQLETLLGVALR